MTTTAMISTNPTDGKFERKFDLFSQIGKCVEALESVRAIIKRVKSGDFKNTDVSYLVAANRFLSFYSDVRARYSLLLRESGALVLELSKWQKQLEAAVVLEQFNMSEPGLVNDDHLLALNGVKIVSYAPDLLMTCKLFFQESHALFEEASNLCLTHYRQSCEILSDLKVQESLGDNLFK